MKCAVITGGGGGLGAAIAARLSRDGLQLALFDRDAQSTRVVAQNCRDAKVFELDILDEAALASTLVTLGEPPDILVNNAGVTAGGGLDQPLEDFRRILEVNLVGAYVLSRLVAPRMAQRGSGVIVNITSGASVATAPSVGGYGPSKAALANLTRAFALRYAPHGVRMNAVAPGFIAAGMGAGNAADPDLVLRREARIPARRLGTPEDVAGVVAFLASDEARYIHGQEIVVDGGLTIAALANTLD